MAHIEGKKNACKFMVCQTADKGALERPRYRRNVIKMHLK